MNALLASIYKQVIEKTGQHHMIDATVSAILQNTHDLHISRFFENDCTVIEYSAEFDSCQEGATSDSIDVGGIPRFRELISLECLKSDSTSVRAIKSQRGLYGNVFKDLGANIEALYAKTGRIIKITTREPVVGFVLVCVTFPDLTADGLDSWIAEQHSSLIVYRAAADILGEIGDTTAANVLRQKAVPLEGHFKTDSNIVIKR